MGASAQQKQQKYYAYCYIEYCSDGSVSFTSSNTTRTLAKSDNTPIKVSNIIGAINELAKHGFEYVDFFYPNTTRYDRQILRETTYKDRDYILMRKLVNADHEITNGLHFVTVKESLPLRQVELPKTK